MAQTFGDVVRQVRSHCPLAPALLARSWVQNGLKKIGDRRHWSHLRGEGELYFKDSRTGTATFTQGSDLVAPGTLTFSAADVGRQLQASGKGIPRTIKAYSAPNAQLDSNWLEATATLSSKVVDAYATMPEDFGSFMAVLDPASQAQLAWWITEDELNIRDPARTQAGPPRAMVSRKLASEPAASLGRVQYELWPYVDTARKVQYYYTKRQAELADGDYFQGVFRAREDVLLLAALVEACEWPGNGEAKNPYFSLQLAERKGAQLRAELEQLETRDEEIYLTWLETVSWIRQRPFTMGDADWLRNHEY